MRRLLALLGIAVGFVAGCGNSADWEIRDCTAEELDFIDAGIELAVAAAPTAGPMLAERYPGEPATYEAIVDRLQRVRERGDIRCADPDLPDDPDWTDEAAGETSRGYANTATGRIVINAGARPWLEARRAYAQGERYAGFSPQGVEKAISAASWLEFRDLKEAARGRFYAPTTAATILVHEAAHLVTGMRYPHTLDGEGLEGTDFVFQAAEAARAGIYWDVWMPERLWLDSLYFDR